MKKLITLLLAVSLMCTAFASCGKDASNDDSNVEETDGSTETEIEQETETETDAADETETENEAEGSEDTVTNGKDAVAEALEMKHTLRFKEDGTFKICVFSDVHAAEELSDQTVKALEAVLEAEKPDFVLFNGDLTTNPETLEQVKANAEKMTKYCVEHRIPWSHVYGNHDDEGRVPLVKQQKVYEAIEYCVSKAGDKELPGVGNYVLPILRSDSDEIAFNIWALDSHSSLSSLHKELNAQVDAVTKHTYPESHYAYVPFEQIRWYYNTSEALEEYNGKKIPAVMCFHIPVPEFHVVADNLKKLGATGDAREGVCSPELNTGMFMAAYERGDVKMFVSGHDHVNDFCGEYCGIKLAYDGSIGFQIYHDDRTMGCRVIEINQDDAWNFTTRMSYINDRTGWNARDDVEVKSSTVGEAPFAGDLLNAETDTFTKSTESLIEVHDTEKLNGEFYSSYYNCGGAVDGAELHIEDGKGFVGSKAYSITKQNDKCNSEFTLYLPETIKLGDAEYLRVWTDLTGVDFRKACFGLVTKDGCVYRTDEFDDNDSLDLLCLAEGETEWKAYAHGGDGCFGSAQSSSVKNFKGWLAVRVSDFLAWAGPQDEFSDIKGSALTSDGEIAGVYFYFDLDSDDMLDVPFYMDQFGLVKDYSVFESVK